MSVTADIQQASTAVDIPSDELITEWISLVVTQAHINKPDAEVSIRITDEDEIQTLNKDYRQKDKPTNVLSFPADIPDFIDSALLGDLVICAPIVVKEAKEQDKTLTAHWAHMVIHGTLHLLGYDHIDDDEAEVMESLEVQLLKLLGFSSPYINDAVDASIND